MTFTTPAFLVFFLIVYSLYWMLGRKGQNLLILTSSLVFYGWWDWRFLFVLLFNAGIDFAVGLALMRAESRVHRQALWAYRCSRTWGCSGSSSMPTSS